MKGKFRQLVKKLYMNGTFLYRTYKEKEVEVYAAQAAFFLLVSFVPFFMCLFSALSLTPITVEYFESVLLEIAPQYMDGLINYFFRSGINLNLVFGLSMVTALWSASKGVQNLTIGLNKIFEINEKRSWLRVRIVSMFYVLFLILLLIASLVLRVWGDEITELWKETFPQAEVVIGIWKYGRMWILFVLMIVLFDLMYIFLPNNTGRLAFGRYFKRMMPGAVTTALCWFGISIGFDVAVTYFGSFAFYGPLASFVLFMFWLCFCMITFMFGGMVNFLNK